MDKKLKSESISIRNKERSKKWKLVNPEGESLIIENLSEFCKDKGLYPENLSRIKNSEKKYKGWMCHEVKN
jgi:hypothetical protein